MGKYYIIEIVEINLTFVLLDSIKSQYKDKSDYINCILSDSRLGIGRLKKPSYIDIRSTMSFDFCEILKSGKHISKLSTTNMEELSKFIQNYKERLEAHIKVNRT